MLRTALAIALFTHALASPSLAAHNPTPAPPQRLFISGHSLVDQPLPNHLAAIAQSLGTPLQWNRQYVVGSSIKTRSAGNDASQAWSGYRLGDNREGNGLDVLQELQRPQTVTGGAYDGLLITEQHSVLGTLVWNDTVRHLRHYHERFIAANPNGRTWFYEPWLDVKDKDRPASWIAYERAAAPVWQCVVARVNHSLQAEGRRDQIHSLPAALALAGLVERATTGAGLPGVSQAGVRQTMDALFADEVHLTPLGSYYMALVSYAGLFGRSPAGAWKPETVSLAAAQSLQSTAWDMVQAARDMHAPSLAQCQQRVQAFIGPYWAYVRDTAWRKEGSAKAHWLWAKHRAQWHWRLRDGAPTNPLRYDTATDKAFWLPAP
jgi:hypothetical protein